MRGPRSLQTASMHASRIIEAIAVISEMYTGVRHASSVSDAERMTGVPSTNVPTKTMMPKASSRLITSQADPRKRSAIEIASSTEHRTIKTCCCSSGVLKIGNVSPIRAAYSCVERQSEVFSLVGWGAGLCWHSLHWTGLGQPPDPSAAAAAARPETVQPPW
eukprot:1576852-Prymnesium_polylepis.2